MTLRSINQRFLKLIGVALIFLLPYGAKSSSKVDITEKQISVAMRTIGHEVLKCWGDHESRVMPIEKIDDQQYRISFEFKFGFDPDDIFTIVNKVMKETGTSSNYLVSVEQCASNDVVHSFEVSSPAESQLNACSGRVVPEDCYSLVVTLLDAHPEDEGGTSPIRSALFIVPILFVFGITGYLLKKKEPVDLDPNLFAVGSTQFDKRNMTLTYQDRSVELSNKEADLLALLYSSANEPVEREVLLQKVWGDEGDYIGRTLDVFISKLRKKLEGDASVKIVNIRGVGYKLVMTR